MDDIQLDEVEHVPINIYDITSHRLEYHTGSTSHWVEVD